MHAQTRTDSAWLEDAAPANASDRACPERSKWLLEMAARACPNAARALRMAARACPRASRALETTARAALLPPERLSPLGPSLARPQRSRSPLEHFLAPHRLEDCEKQLHPKIVDRRSMLGATKLCCTTLCCAKLAHGYAQVHTNLCTYTSLMRKCFGCYLRL